MFCFGGGFFVFVFLILMDTYVTLGRGHISVLLLAMRKLRAKFISQGFIICNTVASITVDLIFLSCCLSPDFLTSVFICYTSENYLIFFFGTR